MIKNYFIKKNETYNEGCNLIVGMNYGNNGIIPCFNNCDNICVSSSGDSICGCYIGHEKITLPDGNDLFIVGCCGDIKCES